MARLTNKAFYSRKHGYTVTRSEITGRLAAVRSRLACAHTYMNGGCRTTNHSSGHSCQGSLQVAPQEPYPMGAHAMSRCGPKSLGL